MRTRRPVAAGRFYQLDGNGLKNEVNGYLKLGSRPDKPVWALMLPHAGHVFCGDVIGKTLGGVLLPSRLIILCPNHTGYGTPLSVWTRGQWLTPLGPVAIDEELADNLVNSGTGFAADDSAHLGEHSIEVLLPFLQEQTKGLKIVPVCVGTRNPGILAKGAKGLARVLKENPDAGLIVSSDMNHYEDENTTIKKDEEALAKALQADPEGLLNVVEKKDISMCGAAPLALALYAARDLGGVNAELVAHTTSGKVSGDYEHTVGYAGLRLYTGARMSG